MAELLLPPAIYERIAAHAERTYPEECCGVLVGRAGRVERIVEAVNTAENRARRYEIAPELLLAVHQESRHSGHDVVGYYHSHPRGPAVPSAFDLEHAWPEVSYVVAAFEDAHVAELRSFRLDPGGERFEEEELIHSPLGGDRGGKHRQSSS